MAKESIRRQVMREFKVAQHCTGSKNYALHNLDAIEGSSESEGDDIISRREDMLERHYENSEN